MDSAIHAFKKYLVDEIRGKSTAHIRDIYLEVDRYSKTPEFMESFKKWSVTRRGTRQRFEGGPRKVGDILR